MLMIENVLNTDELFQNKLASFEPVTGGNVNKAYKVSCEGKAYFVRINGNQSKLLGLGGKTEADACRQAGEMKIAPVVYNSKNEDLYLITDFFKGKCLSKEEARRPDIIKKYMSAIKWIHTEIHVDRQFSIYDLIDKYDSFIKHSSISLPNDFDKIMARYETIKKKRSADRQYGNVFCHNDIWQNNILFDGENICIIDWELCGYSDAFNDLAHIPCLINTSFEEEKWILTCYFGYFDMDMWHILQDLKYVCMIEEAVWSFFHAGITDDMHNQNFDYIKYGNRVTDILLSGKNHF
ncbi:MAG TPA: phosphotransferase [Oscillospiraceae bacterium]|nr:phosphotransferase [Oscillospiraceae bacterium]HPF55457.1 phosphotransferase [Clostridiales bacterium]HPK36229.1 phosphotransferase [Oscillospiraceae bacterium]HPR75503.1 phosphotransferase [Oscillospiraceae bacterium]